MGIFSFGKPSLLTLLWLHTSRHRHASYGGMPCRSTDNTNSSILQSKRQTQHSVWLTITSNALNYLPTSSGLWLYPDTLDYNSMETVHRHDRTYGGFFGCIYHQQRCQIECHIVFTHIFWRIQCNSRAADSRSLPNWSAALCSPRPSRRSPSLSDCFRTRAREFSCSSPAADGICGSCGSVSMFVSLFFSLSRFSISHRIAAVVHPSRQELHVQFFMPSAYVWSTTIQVTGVWS